MRSWDKTRIAEHFRFHVMKDDLSYFIFIFQLELFEIQIVYDSLFLVETEIEISIVYNPALC